MAVELSFARDDSGESPDEVARQLVAWLRSERIPGLLAEPKEENPAQGEMGLVSDLVTVAGPGGAGALIASSILTWAKMRKPGLTIFVKRPDGEEFHIETNTTDSEAEVAMTRFLDAAFPPSKINS